MRSRKNRFIKTSTIPTDYYVHIEDEMNDVRAAKLHIKTFQTQVGPLSMIFDNESGPPIESSFTKKRSGLLNGTSISISNNKMSPLVLQANDNLAHFLTGYLNGSNENYVGSSNLFL